MANAVRSSEKSLERHGRVYAYYAHLYGDSKALSRYKHATENVKFSTCTFSQILYTRQGTPRSSKYTGVPYTGIIYLHETGVSSSG